MVYSSQEQTGKKYRISLQAKVAADPLAKSEPSDAQSVTTCKINVSSSNLPVCLFVCF